MTNPSNGKRGPRILDLAFEVDFLRSREKILLIFMARYGNKSGLCYASQDRLAHDCGCDRSTICRALRKLRSLGLVTPIDDPKRHTITYRLNCGKWRSPMPQIASSDASNCGSDLWQIATQNPKPNPNMNQRRRVGTACGKPIGEIASSILKSKRTHS